LALISAALVLAAANTGSTGTSTAAFTAPGSWRQRLSEILSGRYHHATEEGDPDMNDVGACECDDTTAKTSAGTCPSCNRPTHAASAETAESSAAGTTSTARAAASVAEIEIPPLLNADGTSLSYNLDRSTEENYQILSYNYTSCTGPYSSIRSTLDYSYHSHYQPQRQRVQDAIVSHLLNRTTITCSTTGRSCSTPHGGNWIVFTAGVFGAGKTHTLRILSEKDRFPLAGFVAVDPDEIRRHLPEFRYYVEHDAEGAGEMTRKEAGLMSEILTEAALRQGRNVLVDGSLRDHEWYGEHFDDLRDMHPNLKIAILHVAAPISSIFANVRARSKVTGRVVPKEKIEMALEAVPRSVKLLGPLADFFCELWNSPEEEDVQISTAGVGWNEFSKVWQQSCPPPDPIESSMKDGHDNGLQRSKL